MDTADDFKADPRGLREALDTLLAIHSRPGEAHPHSGSTRFALESLPARLPEHGTGPSEALQRLAPMALGTVARLEHPGFFAHMDPPTPWMTWAATMWSASVNQNLLHPDTGPFARELEALVVSWLAPAFGMHCGLLVPGSTLANLTALWAARDSRGARRVVASTAAHVSIMKAARLLDMKLELLPVDEDQRLRVDALPSDLSDAVVVLTAGTTSCGAIDNLRAGRGAAWRHVDAAWAGPLRLTTYAALLDGIEEADSVAVSAHKWLYQPKESALLLFADPEGAHRALTFGGAYLAAPNVGLLGSHGLAALPLAVTLLAWGRAGVAARIEAGMELAARLGRRIRDDPRLELWRQPATGVVVWRAPGHEAVEVQRRLRDAWVSLTRIGDVTWFRSVAANPNADPDQVVGSVLDALGR